MSERFLQALNSGKVLLMDGAMGTELQRAGIGGGECYELWNLTHPEGVRAIHQAYVIAGAECLLTNTFQANQYSLARHGLQEKLDEINEAGVAIARSVAGAKHFVIGDIGWAPAEELGEVVRSLRFADALLFETWSGIGSAKIERACDAQFNPGKIPILLSYTYRKKLLPNILKPGYDSCGLDPKGIGIMVRLVLKKRGISGLGVNCGTDLDMDDIIQIVKAYRQETDLPIFVRPNAGTPKRVGNCWEYPFTPAMMAERLPELLEAGVSMVGGCCGTTPEHIAAFRPIIDEWNARK